MKRGEKLQKVFFYTNLVPKARLMEILGLSKPVSQVIDNLEHVFDEI